MVVQQQSDVSPFFRVRRLTHANIFVSDLERSLKFYKQVVGLEEVYRKVPYDTPNATAVVGFLGNGNTHHDIAVVARGQRSGLNHLAFELENQVDLLEGYRKSTGVGEKFRTDDHDITRSLYHYDPDGNGIEIYADTTKEWRKLRGDGRTVQEPSFPWTPGDQPRFGPAEAHNYHESPEIKRVEEAVFHPKRITHAVIVAGDFQALYHYYTTMVGLRPALGGPDDPYVVLSGSTGRRHLTLFRGRGRQSKGLHHFGFEVWGEQDLDESEKRLQEAGIEVEHRLDQAEKRSVFIRDPDDFLIEFYVDRPSDATCLGAEEEAALYVA